MSNKYYLPQKMSRVLEKCYQDNHIPDNLRLLLHKHVPVRVIEKPEEKQDSAKTKQDNAKIVWLRDIASKYKADPELLKAARQRWLSYIDALKASFISIPVDWRMVVGLGGNSVFETDMTLHPLYGLPFIPGSALKGLTRAWVETEKNETIQIPGPGGNSIPLVERIFGNQREGKIQRAGSVIFFDAILRDENFTLTLDIMNPHYPRYYQEGNPPSNDQHPIPVPFLTVGGRATIGSRATFLFAIAPRNPLNNEHQIDARTALQWLQQALAEYGIGSKTSSGYGYMQEKPLYKRSEKLPKFAVGQNITGMLLDTHDKDDLQVRLPTFASQALQYKERRSSGYLEYSTSEVLIALVDEEGVANHWRAKSDYQCSFLYEYEQIRDNCTILVCEPSQTSATPSTSGKKNKKAKNKKR
jgi:CRISPR type III-B/RAMP module RAMP protein Cmr6